MVTFHNDIVLKRNIFESPCGVHGTNTGTGPGSTLQVVSQHGHSSTLSDLVQVAKVFVMYGLTSSGLNEAQSRISQCSLSQRIT